MFRNPAVAPPLISILQVRHNLAAPEKPFFRRGGCVVKAAHYFFGVPVVTFVLRHGGLFYERQSERDTTTTSCQCGGSEVRIFCAAGGSCGLLNQSHTRSIGLLVSFRFRSSKRGSEKCCELRNRDTSVPRDFSLSFATSRA